MVEEIIEVIISVLYLKINLLKAGFHEHLQLTLIDAAIHILVVNFPDVINPLSDLCLVGSEAHFADIIGVVPLFVDNLRQHKSHDLEDIYLLAGFFLIFPPNVKQDGGHNAYNNHRDEKVSQVLRGLLACFFQLKLSRRYGHYTLECISQKEVVFTHILL